MPFDDDIPFGVDAPKEPYRIGYNKELLTEKEFYDASKHGCSRCCEQAEVLEDHEIVWTSRNSFLCTDCDDELSNQLEFNENYNNFNKIYH